MGRRNGSQKAAELPQEPAINITPLVDVVFVILIAFIVIAPLLEMDRIELASGGQVPSHIPVRFEDSSPIQIHVQQDNSILFNHNQVTLAELMACLRRAKASYPDARAQLFHHKQAYFGTYQSVKNALEAAEFKEVDIVLSPS
ncbi:MAG: biopolymer transporter ExbD [Verrucomicrobia bacterium]|nr:biopolymer transporter ExbD [Verrucomicrobiota bacterium]MBS0636047.1 biopolymer transporter ExbD [Verrucomicrobiota bacterium]